MQLYVGYPPGETSTLPAREDQELGAFIFLILNILAKIILIKISYPIVT